MPCSSREKIQTQQTYFDISVSHERKLRHCSSCKKNALMHIGIYRRMFLFSKYSRMLDADKAHNCLQATFITVLVCNVPTIPAACSPQEWRTSSLPGKTDIFTAWQDCSNYSFDFSWRLVCSTQTPISAIHFQWCIWEGVQTQEYNHCYGKICFSPCFQEYTALLSPSIAITREKAQLSRMSY